MASKHTLWGIYAAMAVSISMLTFVSWLAYDRIRETGRRTEAVNHTYRVRLKNKDLLVILVNIETGQRGYLVTRLEEYLKPYAESRNELKSVQKSMRLLVRDNPEQLTRLDTINVLVSKNLSVIESGIARAKSGNPIDTLQMKEGRADMEDVGKE